RPCYIDLPMDLLSANADEPAVEQPVEAWRRGAEALPVAEIDRAVRMLMMARRPLILAGGGAWKAAGAIQRLAGRLSIPVVLASSGKGVIPEDHRLSLGDGWMAHQLGREALEQADVVLAVGVRFGPLTTSWWTRRIGGEIIHVDIDPAEIGKHFSTV